MNAEHVIEALRHANATVACAESLTGGMLCSELVSVPGASAVVVGGVVAYATEAKASVLGVDVDALADHGPVSAEVAVQMAERVAGFFETEFGVATTGVAGPQNVGEHPVGEVYIAVSRHGADTVVQRFAFDGEREEIRRAAVAAALDMLAGAVRSGVSEPRG